MASTSAVSPPSKRESKGEYARIDIDPSVMEKGGIQMKDVDFSPYKGSSSVRDTSAFVQPTATSSTAINLTAEPGPKSREMTEHQLSIAELETVLQTNVTTGLSSEEATKRFLRDGPNELTPPYVKPWYLKLLAHVAGGFALLLWVGALLCFIVYGINMEDGIVDNENLTLGIVLVLVVCGTGVFAWWEETKSDAVLAGFMKLIPATCDVIRDGKVATLPAQQLCVGDLVRVQFGKKIPADVIMIESLGVKVDNSQLTGESKPCKLSPGSSDDTALRSKNVAFFGTNCVEGTGRAIVARIGDHTAIGNIASATNLGEKPEPLMKHEIERFIQIIAGIAIFLGILFLILAVIPSVGGSNIKEAIIFCIAIIVANVPEGLLATVTVALTITAKRMAVKQVLVKSNLVVETLGSITAIASDKTGTLTQNRMTVRNAILSDSSIVIAAHLKPRTSSNLFHDAASGNDVGQLLPNRDIPDNLAPGYNELVRCSGLCNHAVFDETENEILVRRTNGDASESALLKFSHSNSSVYVLKKKFPEVACVPFNSTNKIMITIHRVEGSSDYLMIMKGAPEKVMTYCISYSSEGKVLPLTDEMRQKIASSNSTLASNGERVLGFGKLILKGLSDNYEFDTDDISKLNFDISSMEFVGMLSLEDPPRKEVPGAIKCCHDAGIRVIMVTGDHFLTARSIAAQIGIIKDEDGGKNAPIWNSQSPPEVRRDPKLTSVVVTGPDLASLDDADWDYILSRNGIVFARTLPTQKQDIVSKLQLRDEVVAVTGDGVNDSPALKKADVGIAMGSGSEIAKEAADLILLDDNFASIVNGIEEGRLIFANLKKSIAYTLTSNIPEIIPFLATIALQFPLALTTIMILCIDLGTDILPAISFAYEEAESDIMKTPPRNRHTDKLVTGTLISWSYLQIGIIQSFAAYTVFFYVLNREGFSTDLILSSYFRSNQMGAAWKFDNRDVCYYNSLQESGPPVSVTKFSADGSMYGGDYCASLDYRSISLQRAQTAFLACIVVCQIGCGISCKTRLNSIISHGFKNVVFNYGLIQEICLIALLVYAPFMHYIFSTENMQYQEWLIGIPFAAFIIFYDEIRRYFFRKYPNSSFKVWSYF